MESDFNFEFKAPQYIDSIENALDDFNCRDTSFFDGESSLVSMPRTPRRHSLTTKTSELCKTPLAGITRNVDLMTPTQNKPIHPSIARMNLKRKASPLPYSPPAKFISQSDTTNRLKKFGHRMHYKPAGGGPPQWVFEIPKIPCINEEPDTNIEENELNPPVQEESTSEQELVTRNKFNWTNKAELQLPFCFSAKPLKASVSCENIYQFSLGKRVAVSKDRDFNRPGKLSDISNCFDRRSSLLNLSVYERGKVMIERKQEKILKIIEEESSRELREFHANPMPPISSPKISTSKIKFERLSSHIMREITNKELNTEKRAREREMFNNYLKEKEALLAAEKQRAQEEKEALEKNMIAMMRRNLVHKPLPLPPEYQQSKSQSNQ